MKFVMFVRPAGTKSAPWREEYNFPYVKNLHDAACAATAQIADWNARGEVKRGRRRSMVERARELVAVEFNGECRYLCQW
jgi:hypothetical protein